MSDQWRVSKADEQRAILNAYDAGHAAGRRDAIGAFTREDVDLLRSAAAQAAEYAEERMSPGEADAASAPFNDLADRIEALLPPRTNSPTEHTPDSPTPEGGARP